MREKMIEIVVIVQTEGVQRTHPGIRFGHHRIAGFGDQPPGILHIAHHRPARHRDTRRTKGRLHL